MTKTHDYRSTWDTYTSSWKAASQQEKGTLLADAVREDATYTDPLAQVSTREDLIGYMLEFHKQVPGGYFRTKFFLAHNGKSIARWDMVAGDESVLGEGISYGEYDEEGKLTSMTGFFETPSETPDEATS
ncbi:MAG: nuclear transport factor 2 family protein [Polyangiales bacterium]